jgi:hypothetical protein
VLKDERSKLRVHLFALEQHVTTLQTFEKSHWHASPSAVTGVVTEITSLVENFPALALPFNPNDYRFIGIAGDSIEVQSLLAYVQSAIARLRVALESDVVDDVIAHSLEFPFITDPGLRAVLARDMAETQRALVAQCWKATLILAGGVLEALLLDIALRNAAAVLASTAAPKEKDVRKWDLSQLIATCYERKLVDPYIQSVSDAARQYRNLVHPGVELRSGLTYGAEEARIAVIAIEAIHRDMLRP